MAEKNKTNEDFAEEVISLRKRIAQLELLASEYKKLKDLPKDAKNGYKAFFECCSDAIFIVDPQTRMLVDCNNAALEMSGYSKEELLLMRVEQLHPKEALDATMEKFKDLAAGKEIKLDSVILTKSGQRVDVSINTAIVEFQGKAYLMGVFRDITDRKMIQKQLKDYDVRLSYLTKYANDFIILLDENFRFLETNERVNDFYGYTREELIGMFAAQLRTPEVREAFIRQVKPAQTEGKAVYETIHQRKDGTKFPVEISLRAIDAEGKRLYQAVIRDITERKKLEEEVQKRLQELEVFYKVSLGREERIIELKKEVESLRKELRK